MSKRLIVCCDGTWNTPDQKDGGEIRPSNVVKMTRAITPKATDGKVQVVFYDKGVGTGWGLDRLTGGAFGQGLTRNVEDAYRFLIDNYAEGDEIFFFGFSRGAYTARSTGGLIRNCGILKKIHADKFPEALAIYKSKDIIPDSEEAKKFIDAYSRAVKIKFMGVWDTVGALGVPITWLHFLSGKRHQFHDVKLSSYIENAYHAVSIDEKRKPFKPALWAAPKRESQKVEQVWFSGVHTNIGGGYLDSGLSDIAFLWMKEKAEACGLTLDPAYIEAVIHPNYKGVLRNSKKGIYKFTGSYIRPIEKGDCAGESVHPTANKRFEDESLRYKPSNLAAYLNRRNNTNS